LNPRKFKWAAGGGGLDPPGGQRGGSKGGRPDPQGGQMGGWGVDIFL